MIRNTLMMMGLLVLSSVSSAVAGPVQWAGVINSKTGNPSFNLTPTVQFNGIFNAVASVPNTGVFTGSLLFGNQVMNISVGSISRTATTLVFDVAQANNDRNISLNITYNGSFGTWGLGDNSGLDSVLQSIVYNGTGTVSMLELSGLSVVGAYSGTVQAVPEPTSALGLLGLGLGFGLRYRRKRLVAPKR